MSNVSSIPEVVTDRWSPVKVRQNALALLRSFNRDGARSLVVPGEYLETVITK